MEARLVGRSEPNQTSHSFSPQAGKISSYYWSGKCKTVRDRKHGGATLSNLPFSSGLKTHSELDLASTYLA